MAVEVIRQTTNPFDFAISKLGLTRIGFSRISGLGKAYLLRVSQGRHSRIGDVALGHLYREAKERGVNLDAEIEAEYGTDDIEEAWENWVLQHRRLQTIPEPVKDTRKNPFQRLVVAIGGVARTSALLAVPDPLVERYAKGATPRMPRPIEVALLDMDYPHTGQLKAAMEKWVREH